MHAKHDPIKMVALKLTTLSWIDRVWLLSKLESDTRKKVKNAYDALRKLGIENPQELLMQLSKTSNVTHLHAGSLSDEVAKYLQQIEAKPDVVTPNVSELLKAHLPTKSDNEIARIERGQA